MTSARVDLVFDALGNPTRRTLLAAVANRGTATATELAAELPVTRQAVQKQLAALANAGLMRATHTGRETRYETTLEPLEDAIGWIVTRTLAEKESEYRNRRTRDACAIRTRPRARVHGPGRFGFEAGEGRPVSCTHTYAHACRNAGLSALSGDTASPAARRPASRGAGPRFHPTPGWSPHRGFEGRL